jgi:hypothetical protein
MGSSLFWAEIGNCLSGMEKTVQKPVVEKNEKMLDINE